MKHNFKRWLLGIGLALLAVAAACTQAVGTGTSTANGNATATPSSSSIPVVNTSTGANSTPSTSAADLTPQQVLDAQDSLYTSLYKTAVKSVVRISTTTATGAAEGSGWVWDAQGHIVTNYHVVQGAQTISVHTSDGYDYPATVVGTDPQGDIAVIQVNGANLSPIAVGSSSTLQTGQAVVAIGNPFGQDFTMTTGIVSAVGRAIDSGFSRFQIPAVIQTDAAINPGNSGGPLMDTRGRVIGINTQISSQSGQNSGVGFAVPVDLVKKVVPQLIAGKQVQYAFLGITLATLDQTARQTGNLPADLQGAIVLQVQQGSPADQAGLIGDSRAQDPLVYDGDVITKADNTKIVTSEDLIAYLAIYKNPGDTVTLTVHRNGQDVPVTVTLGSRAQAGQ